MTIDPGANAIPVTLSELRRSSAAWALIQRHLYVERLLERRWESGWIVEDAATSTTSLPPDLTRGRWPNMCTARHGQDWTCTRIADHTGRHAAGDGEHIVAVWGDVCRPVWRGHR